MKWLLKSFKNGIFSCRRQQRVWGGGEQDTQSPCLPVSCLPTPCSGDSIPRPLVGEGQKRPPPGQAWEGKKWGAGWAGGTERGSTPASASLLCVCLCVSNYAQVAASPRFRRPPRSPSSAPCIPAGCRARGPYGGNNKTINFPLKNNICGFLGRRAAAIPTQRHISHPHPHHLHPDAPHTLNIFTRRKKGAAGSHWEAAGGGVGASGGARAEPLGLRF